MKMNKRMLKVAVVSALTVAFAVPAFANPFTDVPVKHWSYDSVNKLAQAGIIDGYNDGTFKGDKTVTRYEMAQMVAKAMTKSLNADQKATVDKLAKEFGTELNTLGVKVEGLQSQVDNMVKISGDARVRYTNVENTNDKSDLRTRVSFDGKINSDLKYNARLSASFNPSDNTQTIGVKLDTANVTFGALGLTNTVGRQDVKLGSGILFDSQMTGFAAQAGALKLYAGNNAGTTAIPAPDRMYAAEYGFNALGAKVTADYLKTGDDKAYGINATTALTNNVTGIADYIKNDTTGATATAFGVKFNKAGLTVMHRDADANVYNAYSSADLIPLSTTDAIKGMEYQLDKNLGKNATLNVKYQDFDNMDTRTSAAVNVKF